MKADERKDGPDLTPPGVATPPAHDPTPGSVSEGLANLWDAVRASGVWHSRAVGVVLAVAVVGGLWWFLAASSRQAASKVWTSFALATPGDLEKIAADNKTGVVGKAARLEEARVQFGPEGVSFMAVRDRDRRTKGVANVEKARDSFLKLADEFPNDLTLRAACLAGAAEAELALVGVPKEGSSDAFRGSVEKAVELYRKLAQAAGEKSPVGEKAAKRADELQKNADEVRRVGVTLNQQMSPPPPPPEIKAPIDLTPKPGVPADGPKAPLDPIAVPTPPATKAAGPAITPVPPTSPPPPAPVPSTPNPAITPVKPSGPPPTGK